MALARIFSRYPEQTTTLAEQLEQQGYRVEVLSPDEAPTTLADLEIQLEACDPADVLRRAAELASQWQADIAIAPGALSASGPAEEVVYAPAAPEFTASVTEPAILPAAMEAEPHDDVPAQEARPNRLAQVGRTSGAALAAFAAGAGEFLASARAAFRERLEQARVLAAEVNERRQQRMLELTHRRAEARQHVVALESSRRALAVYLQLQRDYPDVVADAGDKPTPATEPRESNWWARIRAMHVSKWEAVLAGAVSAIALFVAGLAVASFHSRPALTANGGVTLHSGVTLPATQPKAAAPARPSPARKATPKPAVQARSTRRTAPARRPAQRNRDLVARDVVVRHFAARKSPPPPQTNGWKHFSDESN